MVINRDSSERRAFLKNQKPKQMEAILKIAGALSFMIVGVAIAAYQTARYLVHFERKQNPN